jgi:hypothetical protein
MSRLRDRLRRLEGKRRGQDRPRIIPFPIDGMTAEEIEAALASWRPLTLEEFVKKHGVQVCVRPAAERPE